MTTNIERTADILIDWADSEGGLTAIDDDYGGDMTGAAEALADAGLLMPGLPAPRTVDRYPGSACWEASIDPSVAARRHVWVRVDHLRRIKTNITGEVTPDEAREAAYALLAAADHAETFDSRFADRAEHDENVADQLTEILEENNE